MKIEIELADAEIKEAVLDIIAHDYAKRLDAERSTVKYVTRTEIKEVIRGLLRERMDEYAELAVNAASKSIENRAVKKLLAKLEEER
ncbi:MAG: hypothetical protein U0L88_16340 [Acutalibacteraceae bacterium]|nr:hypothetical protein [Acutalibacteraceae bacterium]